MTASGSAPSLRNVHGLSMVFSGFTRVCDLRLRLRQSTDPPDSAVWTQRTIRAPRSPRVRPGGSGSEPVGSVVQGKAIKSHSHTCQVPRPSSLIAAVRPRSNAMATDGADGWNCRRCRGGSFSCGAPESRLDSWHFALVVASWNAAMPDQFAVKGPDAVGRGVDDSAPNGCGGLGSAAHIEASSRLEAIAPPPVDRCF